MHLFADSACCAHASGGHAIEDFDALGVCGESARGAEFALSGTLPHYGPDLVIEPVHLDISIVIRIQERSASLSVIQTFSNPHATSQAPGDPAALSRAVLNAVGLVDMNVTAVDAAGTPIAGNTLNWRYDGTILTIDWLYRFDPHEQRYVKFDYEVVDPKTGLFFDVPNAAYPGYPDRVLHAITDHEPERARYWLPIVDFPAVRTTLAFAITAPKDLVAVANGALVSETIDETKGLKTTRYRLDEPCPSYLICLAVGDFISIEDTPVRDIEIKYFAPHGVNPSDLKLTLGRTPAMIRWIEQKLDFPFPWPKYYQIFSKYIGGAMENISLVTWLDRLICDQVSAQEYGQSVDGTNIHEMAHTYFGDLVVIRHFEHTWLKEGWATYIDVLWIEDNASMDEFRYRLYLKNDGYIASTGSYMRPIVTRLYNSSWSMFDGHSYPGAASRLHVLRKHVGDDAFFRGVRTYLKLYARKTTETDDFRKCIEVESGLNLVPFFDQWFYSKGYPKLKGSFDHDAFKGIVTVSMEQMQVDTSAGVPFFHIHVDVKLTSDDGKTHVGQVVFTDASSHKSCVSFVIGKAKPKTLCVDPDGHMLFSIEMNPGEDVLVATARDAGDVPNRIRALGELVKIGSVSALRQVRDIVLAERFFGVRVQTALALGRAKTDTAIALLGDILLNETDPRSFFQILYALTSVPRNTQFCDAVRTLLRDRTDIPYRGRAALLKTLGEQRDPNDFDYLMSVAKDVNQVGQHGLIRAGALRALAATRDPTHFAYLVSRVGGDVSVPGVEPETCRPVLMSAIATSAAWQPDQQLRTAIEILEHHLRDRDISVCFSSARGLLSLESRASAGIMSSVASVLDDRDAVSMRQIVRRLRDATRGVVGNCGVSSQKVRDMVTLIETLENRVKKLEEAERARDARDAAVKEAAKEAAKGGDDAAKIAKL